jgi:hypothetical protein
VSVQHIQDLVDEHLAKERAASSTRSAATISRTAATAQPALGSEGHPADG